jgi:general secretion pathway protein L
MSEQEPEAVDASEAIRAAFAQWRDTLGQMARSALGDAGEEPDRLQAYIEGQTLRLVLAHGAQARTLGAVALDQEDPSQHVRTVLATHPNIRDVAVHFSEHDVLRPSLNLPYASYDNLRKALHFELERLSPVSPQDVYFDFVVIGRDREARSADLALRIIRRDIVASAIEVCEAAGLAVSAIYLGSDIKPADWRSFPINRWHLARAVARRHALQILAGTALVLLILILLAVYLRGAETAEYLTDELSTESLRASRVERLQHRIDQAATQLAFLNKQKQAPLFVAVLNDVTRALPNGTWITEFSLSANKVHIAGYSHAASDLIGIFDRSGRFANALFTAPVTQGSSPGLERFDLTFDVAGATP